MSPRFSSDILAVGLKTTQHTLIELASRSSRVHVINIVDKKTETIIYLNIIMNNIDYWTMTVETIL